VRKIPKAVCTMSNGDNYTLSHHVS